MWICSCFVRIHALFDPFLSTSVQQQHSVDESHNLEQHRCREVAAGTKSRRQRSKRQVSMRHVQNRTHSWNQGFVFAFSQTASVFFRARVAWSQNFSQRQNSFDLLCRERAQRNCQITSGEQLCESGRKHGGQKVMTHPPPSFACFSFLACLTPQL